jgi:asparagine synthase (glutamine-hydrolysing)
MHAMGGILAVVTFDQSPPAPTVIESMLAAAPHLGQARPWVGQGAYVAALGSGSSLHADDSEALILDGRIDNAEELAEALTLSGPVSDAELVHAAHRRWGAAAIDRLVGDFVLMLWDARARRLSVARDAMGSRNIHYRVEDGRRALVGTELKQLLAAPGVPCRPNEEAIIADLAGLYALPEMTAYVGISQVPPAHRLTIDRKRCRLDRYWTPERRQPIRHRHERDYAEHLLDLFKLAVRARVDPTRPTGILLSGGIDSTSIVSTAAWLIRSGHLETSDVRAYTWAFDEVSDSDERDVARPVAAHAQVPLTEIPGDDAWPLSDSGASPDRDDPYSDVFQPLFDRTFAGASNEGCVTVITANRGDDLMGNWIYDDLGLALAGRLPSLARDLRAYRRRYQVGPGRYLVERILKPLFTTAWPPGRWEPARSRLIGRRRPVPPPWIPPQHATRAAEIMEIGSRTPPIRGHARLQRYTSALDLTSLRLAEHRQRSAARLGMVHADPWSDRRLVEFALAVPQWRLQRYSREKYLAREAMRGVMPERERLETRHGGAAGLFRRAFNEREVDSIRGLMQTSRAAKEGWLDSGAVLDIYDAYLRTGSLAYQIWFPLTVERWLRAWWE